MASRRPFLTASLLPNYLLLLPPRSLYRLPMAHRRPAPVAPRPLGAQAIPLTWSMKRKPRGLGLLFPRSIYGVLTKI